MFLESIFIESIFLEAIFMEPIFMESIVIWRQLFLESIFLEAIFLRQYIGPKFQRINFFRTNFFRFKIFENQHSPSPGSQFLKRKNTTYFQPRSRNHLLLYCFNIIRHITINIVFWILQIISSPNIFYLDAEMTIFET